ncbi:MAG: DNA polymerase IV [Deltaproteobacteria bacterium]|nr:DNA polymerase IV [Deltaproteobacteria bacterium]
MSEPWPRIILHADMDAFFAAVEQLDDPSLRGKPLLIGSPSDRGVVTTASYEARPFGVGSAMPMVEARRRCPQALIVPPRHARYAEVSRQVMEVFHDFSPTVEALSLDEAFLDMSGAERLFGTPREMGLALKAAVKAATGGLTVSVGAAGCKYVAKVASDFDKPDGLTVVPPEESVRFLAPLPLSRLWGVGPAARQRIEALGLSTIGEVRSADPARLERALGSLGRHIAALSRADDPRPVVGDHEAKSIGAEATLDRDVLGAEEIKPHLLASADRIARRLRRAGLVAHGVRAKLKTRRHRIVTRQVQREEGLDSADEIYAIAVGLLPAFDLSEPMRLVGIAAFDLVPAGQPAQADLFEDGAHRKRQALDRAVDAITGRFGRGSIHRASQRPGSRPDPDE